MEKDLSILLNCIIFKKQNNKEYKILLYYNSSKNYYIFPFYLTKKIKNYKKLLLNKLEYNTLLKLKIVSQLPDLKSEKNNDKMLVKFFIAETLLDPFDMIVTQNYELKWINSEEVGNYLAVKELNNYYKNNYDLIMKKIKNNN